MSDPVTLFAEMDRRADALRESNPDLRCSLELELRLLFRELQRKHHPTLTRDEWLPLNQIWLDGYIATLEARERRWHAHVCKTVGIS